jgi:hypothetical protein
VRGGGSLRRSTLDWYAAHREALSLRGSLEAIEAGYAELSGAA